MYARKPSFWICVLVLWIHNGYFVVKQVILNDGLKILSSASNISKALFEFIAFYEKKHNTKNKKLNNNYYLLRKL